MIFGLMLLLALGAFLVAILWIVQGWKTWIVYGVYVVGWYFVTSTPPSGIGGMVMPGIYFLGWILLVVMGIARAWSLAAERR